MDPCLPLLTPSGASSRGNHPLIDCWWKASWSRRVAWPPPRTCPDRRDPPQTERVPLVSAHDLHLRTLCPEQTWWCRTKKKKSRRIVMGVFLNWSGGLTFILVKHFVFYPVLLHTAGIQTFLEDNDKLVTKHMGQAMLGWWSVVILPLGQLLQLGHHVQVFPRS